MKIQNISNKGRNIFLFCRNDDGSLEIIEDNSFYPYWYEPDDKGNYFGYDGVSLRKVVGSNPSDISKTRSKNSYSSDIPFPKKYLIDRVDKIDFSPIKYFFIDIEILTDSLPNIHKANKPISCITIYNSLYKIIQTWWLPDYKSENEMLDNFVTYMRNETPDILLAWNIGFDYTYLYNRIKDFAKRISPIGSDRYSPTEVKYPDGISIVDYLSLFRKIKPKEFSYALDNISQKYLGRKKKYTNNQLDFSTLNTNIRERNRDDIKIMIDLEKQFKILTYYDEIRRLSKTEWEDLIYNSRIMEMLLLEEAKLKNIVLPNRKNVENAENIQGATREASQTGVFNDCAKCDLGSAYPTVIKEFCLDISNIRTSKEENCIEINGTIFEQNPNSLLPSVVEKLLKIKDELKREKKNNPSNTIISLKYDAIKGIVNSIYGVSASEYFRLYDHRVGSTIPFLVRELLLYAKNRLEEEGYEVIYWDTDGIVVNTKENISSLLNLLVNEWASKYGKESINMSFDYEGYFEKLFILGKCHYVGYLNKGDYVEKEIKGVEIKRTSSSSFEAEFQEKLIDKILDKNSIEDIEKWIKRELLRIRNLPLEYISFPCKVGSTKYKNLPIFIRALENTKRVHSSFDVNVGERYYYAYVLPRGDIDVLAFKEEDKTFMEDFKLNWKKMQERNIENKIEKINECLGWNISISNQKRLF